MFDVAGTTVLDGDAVTECLALAVRRRREVTTTEVLKVMGLPKPVAIRQLLVEKGLPPAGLEADVASIHEEFRAALISRYRNGALTPVPDVAPVFVALRKAGIRVVLDTGFSRDILDVVIDRLGWRETVDFSVASDEVQRGRPFPDLIHRAMALVQIAEPAMVAKIGDTPSDLDEGLAAQCGRVVGVTYGTHTRRAIERPGRHHRSVARFAAAPQRAFAVTRLRQAVVGAGIVGLALARSLAVRGAAVTVFEADAVPQGASVRNFGTLWPIGQPSGSRRAMALRSLAIWREILQATGAWFAPDGSLHVAYHDDEFNVLAEFAARANADGFPCELRDAAATLRSALRFTGRVSSARSGARTKCKSIRGNSVCSCRSG